MSVILKRQAGDTIRVQDLIAVLNRANPDALVFVREGGLLVMPSVREVIPAMVGIGTFHEDQGGDELPAIVIE